MAEPAFLLDSNICIYATNGRSDVLMARLMSKDEGSLAISSITLAEIMLGYRTDVERAALDALLETLQVLPFGEAAARRYAMLPFRRGSFDRLIAAHALSLGLTLVTGNERDFADVPELSVENWTKA